MGHKAHPIGLRLGIHRKWKSNWFFESKNYPIFIHLNLNIEKFFKGFLYFNSIKTLLIKCQLVKLPSNQIFIFIFYYRLRKKLKKNFYKFKIKTWKSNLENYFLTTNLYSKGTESYYKKFLAHKIKNLLTKSGYNYNISNSILTHVLISDKKKFYNITENLYYKLKLYKFFIQNLHILLKLKNKVLIIKVIHYFKIKLKLIRYKLNLNKLIFLKTSLTFFKQHALIYIYLKKLYNLNYQLIQLKNKNLNNCKEYILLLKKLKTIKKHLRFLKFFLFRSFYLKQENFNIKKLKRLKTKKNLIITKKNYYTPISKIKKFLIKLTNCKINLIFINALSFTKFFYTIMENKKKNKDKEKFNVLKIQRLMLNKFKYHAIFIKDFIHLTFICLLLKETPILVSFIGEQFKRLPKNRKQLKLLTFITQSLKILCQQRKEFLGFKLQIKGRLNRRNRTHKWTFKKGILPIQTNETRVEYGYSEGLTRSGLIGIKLWIFYQKSFKNLLKKKLIQYLYYSKYKQHLNKSKKIFNPLLFTDAKTKSKKISKKQQRT